MSPRWRSASKPTAARGCRRLLAAGYTVYAVNPLQAARYRERHSVSGAKSDVADAHSLADMVRTDAHQLRPVAPRQRAGRGDQGGCSIA